MYTAIRSYDRYFAQAARLARPAAVAVKPAAVKSETFTLVSMADDTNYRFTVQADGTVLVTRWLGRSMANSWVKSKEDARGYWKYLTGRGYRKF